MAAPIGVRGGNSQVEVEAARRREAERLGAPGALSGQERRRLADQRLDVSESAASVPEIAVRAFSCQRVSAPSEILPGEFEPRIAQGQ